MRARNARSLHFPRGAITAVAVAARQLPVAQAVEAGRPRGHTAGDDDCVAELFFYDADRLRRVVADHRRELASPPPYAAGVDGCLCAGKAVEPEVGEEHL